MLLAVCLNSYAMCCFVWRFFQSSLFDWACSRCSDVHHALTRRMFFSSSSSTKLCHSSTSDLFSCVFWFLRNLQAASDLRWINVALKTRLFFFFIVISFCMRFLINKCRINAFFFSLLIFIINVFLRLNFVRIFCCFVFATSFRRAFCVSSVSSKRLFFIAIAYVSMSVFVLNVLLSIRFNFLFMFINFCLMSLFLMNSRKSSSSTILSMRKVVESLIVSKFFSFSNLSMSFCICCLRSCKLIRDAMKNDLETSSQRSVGVDMIDTRLSLSQCLDR